MALEPGTSEEHVVEVRATVGRGRGLFATKDIAPGACLLEEAPLVESVVEATWRATCASCFKYKECGEWDAICPRCHAVTYCGASCRDRHAGHGRVCDILKSVRKTTAPETVMDALRLVLRVLAEIQVKSPSFEATILNAYVPDEPTEDDVAMSQSVWGLLTNVEKAQALLAGVEYAKLQKFLLVDKYNSFAIMAPNGRNGERRVRSQVLMEKAAMMNSQCFPNACRVEKFKWGEQNKTTMRIYSMCRIPKGSEVVICYTPLSWSLEERKEKLAEEFGFVCRCRRCILEQLWEEGEEDNDGEEDDSTEEGRSSGGEEEEAVGDAGEDVVEDGGGGERVENEEAGGGGGAYSGATSGGSWDRGECGEDEGEDYGGGDEGEESPEISPQVEHTLFLLRYLCPHESCGGTLYPIAHKDDFPTSDEGDPLALEAPMECNLCERVRSHAEFVEELVGE